MMPPGPGLGGGEAAAGCRGCLFSGSTEPPGLWDTDATLQLPVGRRPGPESQGGGLGRKDGARPGGGLTAVGGRGCARGCPQASGDQGPQDVGRSLPEGAGQGSRPPGPPRPAQQVGRVRQSRVPGQTLQPQLACAHPGGTHSRVSHPSVSPRPRTPGRQARHGVTCMPLGWAPGLRLSNVWPVGPGPSSLSPTWGPSSCHSPGHRARGWHSWG